MSKTKEFCFGNYDVIGFDLDNTLLRYNLTEMIPLEYEQLRDFLVNNKNYPAELKEKNLDMDFLQKGLILDTERGNILKLSCNAQILRATHGSKLMTTEQIMRTYGKDRKWDIATQFLDDPLSTWNGPLSEKIRCVLDSFDIVMSALFAQVVDMQDAAAQKEGRPYTKAYKIWPDILAAAVHIYSREHFADLSSGYFLALQNKPCRYIMQCNWRVLKFLRDLRAAKKKIFLLTGSNIDFAHCTASHALGSNWAELFDCVICYAKKPGFFSGERPFLRVEELNEVPGSEIDINETLKLQSSIYSQGNWKQLRASFAKELGKVEKDIRALYLGDNLIQDVYAPVKHHDIDAVVLCEEMLGEDIKLDDYEFKDVVASNFWGSYFYVDNEVTLWSHIIAKYSLLCAPLVDCLTSGAPASYKFISPNESGFYPKQPMTLPQK